MSEEIEVVAFRLNTKDGCGYFYDDSLFGLGEVCNPEPLMTVDQCKRLLDAKDSELEQYKRDAERRHQALKFYAEKDHYHLEEEPWFIEDGSVARSVLSTHPSQGCVACGDSGIVGHSNLCPCQQSEVKL